jgi:hypothetical protein
MYSKSFRDLVCTEGRRKILFVGENKQWLMSELVLDEKPMKNFARFGYAIYVGCIDYIEYCVRFLKS